jgi:hypothetical protein
VAMPEAAARTFGRSPGVEGDRQAGDACLGQGAGSSRECQEGLAGSGGFDRPQQHDGGVAPQARQGTQFTRRSGSEKSGAGKGS